MDEKNFKYALILIAIGFTIFFLVAFVPPVIADQDLLLVLSSGFVNPYATGYSVDLITCWVVLIFWILYESKSTNIKHGWVCIVLGLVPGVAVGLATYLLLRHIQLKSIREVAS